MVAHSVGDIERKSVGGWAVLTNSASCFPRDRPRSEEPRYPRLLAWPHAKEPWLIGTQSACLCPDREITELKPRASSIVHKARAKASRGGSTEKEMLKTLDILKTPLVVENVVHT